MNVQHVVPVGDVVDHDRSTDDCVCGPDIEFVDGGYIVVHHSLDGREQFLDRHEKAIKQVDSLLDEMDRLLGDG